jgi:hypothetical protein
MPKPTTFIIHNDNKKDALLESGADIFTIPGGGTLELPLKWFRHAFMVRCKDQAHRDLGYCTQACPGVIEGGSLGAAYSYTKGSAE